MIGLTLLAAAMLAVSRGAAADPPRPLWPANARFTTTWQCGDKTSFQCPASMMGVRGRGVAWYKFEDSPSGAALFYREDDVMYALNYSQSTITYARTFTNYTGQKGMYFALGSEKASKLTCTDYFATTSPPFTRDYLKHATFGGEMQFNNQPCYSWKMVTTVGGQKEKVEWYTTKDTGTYAGVNLGGLTYAYDTLTAVEPLDVDLFTPPDVPCPKPAA
jgi:hypothetical protein